MSNKRRNKIARAAPQGGTIISPQQMQVYMAQMQAAQKSGRRTQNNSDALFSPGAPLETQPGINPGGFPVKWMFPPSYNTAPVDRTMGNQAIPPFQQLRILAKTSSGIGLCERAILDLVPRMGIKVGLTKAAQAQGAEEKNFQEDIAFFTDFFTYPTKVLDKRGRIIQRHDIHHFIRSAWREQTQIDELYLYKKKDRAGRLLSLDIVAGDTMKPLLDDWGYTIAFQQYPRGVPGAIFTMQQMIRYNETPAADTPFGTSRIERIMLRVNQALRKETKDLNYFTEGNQPFAIMEVPEASNWTPDQIEAYEVMWNAMQAGSSQQQVRMRFTQPGMKYTPLEVYQLITDFDQFLLNIEAAAYGLSMQDLAFTGDIHKSSGDSQQNMMFRRTLEPTAVVYATILTRVMREDFPPERHGALLEVSFSGYEVEEDIQMLSTSYSTLAAVGAIAPSDIAHIMHLPEVPNTGPFILTKTGPLFLKDYEEGSTLRQANTQAAMAGMQLAAQAPQQQDKNTEEDSKNVKGTPTQQKGKEPVPQKLSRSLTVSNADDETSQSSPDGSSSDGATTAVNADYRRWKSRAIDDIKAGRSQRGFTTTLIPEHIHKLITNELAQCMNVEEVRHVFERARQEEVLEGVA